jgi:hypothetical protein
MAETSSAAGEGSGGADPPDLTRPRNDQEPTGDARNGPTGGQPAREHDQLPDAPKEDLPLVGPKKPLAETWTLARAREGLRATVAKWLLSILTLVVVAALADVSYLFFAQRASTPDLANDLRTVLEILIPPLVGLVGAVTGFYFGTRAAEEGGSGASGAPNDTSSNW